MCFFIEIDLNVFNIFSTPRGGIRGGLFDGGGGVIEAVQYICFP